MDQNLPVFDPSSLPEGEVDGATATAKLAELRAGLLERVREGVLVAFSSGLRPKPEKKVGDGWWP